MRTITQTEFLENDFNFVRKMSVKDMNVDMNDWKEQKERFSFQKRKRKSPAWKKFESGQKFVPKKEKMEASVPRGHWTCALQSSSSSLSSAASFNAEASSSTSSKRKLSKVLSNFAGSTAAVFLQTELRIFFCKPEQNSCWRLKEDQQI